MRLIYKTYRIKEGRQASKHLLALRESSLTMYLPGLNSETVLGNKLCNKAIKKKNNIDHTLQTKGSDA